MTTVIFVHGTGGREREYKKTLELIQKGLDKCEGVKLASCLWGDNYGTKLNAKGASIPSYELTGGLAQSNNEENDQILLWAELYRDPLYEIRLLSLRSTARGQRNVPGQSTPSQDLRHRVEQLRTSTEAQTLIQNGGIEGVFEEAYQQVTQSEFYEKVLNTASRPLDQDYAIIARAIVAQAILICKLQDIYLPLLVDPVLRDKTVDSLTQELTQNAQSKGIVGDIKKLAIKGLYYGLGEPDLKRKRGAITNAVHPFAGDILLYQAKGKKIRQCIKTQIENVKDVDLPVCLLGHSLGGIACVDLLIEQELPQVKLLATVGSQAPFLYEIDALQTLSYGEPLPDHFPKWLNIYDLRDILSYVGDQEGLFPGRIEDVEVNNKQPFPEAHSAYWSNPEIWNAIINNLP